MMESFESALHAKTPKKRLNPGFDSNLCAFLIVRLRMRGREFL